MSKRHLVTAALPYANGPVHIGHIAGCYLPADIYVRFLRQMGEDVRFICGSDEHGMAITMRARKEGVEPRAIVDRYHNMMKGSFEEFGISFDIYSRTSSEDHHETAQDFFLKLHEQGVFQEKETDQYYDPEARQFLADRYIMGTCPACGHTEAYGDQCENCGRSLSPTELKDPRSTLSGSAPVLKKTTNWFLPLDEMADGIRSFLDQHKDWKPNVHGQCMSWLDAGDGLQPRSMTRDLDWGIRVPVKGGEDKVLYVWFDAPIGYISASKELMPDQWRSYWQDPDSRLVHFIGKDNIVFHCIVFPAMLMAHGSYNLPEAVPANEFLNLEGQKISTSRNWAVWLHEYLEDFPGKQDVLRYVLCATAPETKDNDFTWKDFQQRNNSELVAILGNFLNRVFVLTDKYYGGQLPDLDGSSDSEQAAWAEFTAHADRMEASIGAYRFREALGEFMGLARIGNKYLAEQEPWKKIKTDPERAAVILALAARMAAFIGQAAEAFLPFTAARIRNAFGMELMSWEELKKIDPAKWLKGVSAANPGLLFDKIEDEKMDEQRARLTQSEAEQSTAPAVDPQKETVDFESFQRMDIRVAQILSAERVPKTDKLLKFEVDTGLDRRTVVSGIAEFFDPKDLVGKRVPILMNLAPRKIRGIESEGMLLFGEDSEGSLKWVEPDAGLSPGSSIG
ncbi:MAG: methionine--tRNA ligase [Flavobacteriia bacterium]|nr:methionine--tRNA ligase [Flavobacteriia bacterium]